MVTVSGDWTPPFRTLLPLATVFLVVSLAVLTACESSNDVVLPTGRTVYCGGTCRVARAGEDREIALYSRHVRRTERVIDGRLLRCDWYTLPRYRDREVVRCGWRDAAR